MKGKIVFVNPASRLAAAHIGAGQCIVFEYTSMDHFKEGEMVDRLRDDYGHAICERMNRGVKATINVLSPPIDRCRAELVVAPWRETITVDDFYPLEAEEYSFA
ncbi:MAG: hypothetical protein K6L76_02720 [Agarilytica sp.]